jgi:hypothetical protein
LLWERGLALLLLLLLAESNSGESGLNSLSSSVSEAVRKLLLSLVSEV